MATIGPNIVTVTAQVTAAPTPSQLQQSGAIISEGGTTQTAGTLAYYGTLAAVQAVLSTAGNYEEVGANAASFFAQGGAVGVYVLELGAESTPALGIAAFQTWLTANPGQIYVYAIPSTWDSDGAALNTLAAAYSSATGKTYFVVPTTASTISAYTAANKAIFAIVQSPTAPSTEYDAGAWLYNLVCNNPSAATPVPPLGFRFVSGVTAWALASNLTTITDILSAYGNIILNGAEGGLSNNTLRNGTTIDGTQFMDWYAIDWLQIQSKQALAAAVINGSNSNPPLYYNQIGINTLLAVLQNIGNTGISSGLLLSATFTAQSFTSYTTEYPDNYAAGIYGGFACTATPQVGFEQITFAIDATQFVA